MLSAGMLVLGTGVGIVTVNLATGTATPLPGTGPEGQSLLEAFAWPYLAYTDRGSGSLAVVHIRDLRSGSDVALHQLDSMEQYLSSPAVVTLDAGTDTLFVTVGSGIAPGNCTPTLTTLYELDHAMMPASPLRTIALYGGDLGGLMGWRRSGRTDGCERTAGALP